MTTESGEALRALSIREAGARLRAGSLTSVTLTRAFLERIAAADAEIHAFVRVTEERALRDAAHADDDLRAGVDRGPLQGIPYAMKDVIETAGIVTSSHSRIHQDHVPSADAPAVARLARGGAVLLGKLATYEFAMGGPSFDLPMPPARNPRDADHIPGGSSSGSSAAVAAGMVRMALGTDSAGSIRWPAHCCGVVGFKPTTGLVSTRGVLPLSPSLDHVGPLAATVDDAALTMQVICGFDAADPRSVDVSAPRFTADLGAGVDGLRLGVPRAFLAAGDDVDPAVTAVFEQAVRVLEGLGATVEDVTLPDFRLFDACNRIILAAEAFSIHEDDISRRPSDYGRYAYQRIASGATLSAADYLRATRARGELTARVDELLRGYDALVLPTAVRAAPRFSDYGADSAKPAGIRTQPFNLTGHPALSVPMGVAPEGLPLGLQVIGRRFEDATVLRIGAAFEAAVADAVTV